MKTFTKTLFAGIAASAMIAGAATTAAVAMDYKGKTVKIVIPYGPGGTYDKYGVAFSNHLGNHIPGNPNIILQHMPGAGGAKAMNWFANVAPKDGLTLIVPLDNGVTNQLMRPKKCATTRASLRGSVPATRPTSLWSCVPIRRHQVGRSEDQSHHRQHQR